MRRTREKALELRQPATPTPPAAGQPPKGMMDLEAARFWAGRGPRARRNRPPYALGAMD